MASRADQLASNLNFSKFGQATELKNRIWFTIGALIVFRFLSFVPLPGVDPVALASRYSQAASGGVLDRSEERRVGRECVSTCRSRWSRYQYKRKQRISRQATRGNLEQSQQQSERTT